MKKVKNEGNKKKGYFKRGTPRRRRYIYVPVKNLNIFVFQIRHVLFLATGPVNIILWDDHYTHTL